MWKSFLHFKVKCKSPVTIYIHTNFFFPKHIVNFHLEPLKEVKSEVKQGSFFILQKRQIIIPSSLLQVSNITKHALFAKKLPRFFQPNQRKSILH